MSEREEGFYWIKFDDCPHWALASYFGSGAWMLIGSAKLFVEAINHPNVIEVHDAVRIHPPTGGE